MEQRVSIITLGVADVEASKAFYERLGWRVGLDVEETVFFQIGNAILTLWGRDKLAADSGVTDNGGWGGVTLAHNVGSRDEVDRVIEEARTAGRRSGGSRPRRSMEATPASSSTPTAILGRSPTTRASN